MWRLPVLGKLHSWPLWRHRSSLSLKSRSSSRQNFCLAVFFWNKEKVSTAKIFPSSRHFEKFRVSGFRRAGKKKSYISFERLIAIPLTWASSIWIGLLGGYWRRVFINVCSGHAEDTSCDEALRRLLFSQGLSQTLTLNFGTSRSIICASLLLALV